MRRWKAAISLAIAAALAAPFVIETYPHYYRDPFRYLVSKVAAVIVALAGTYGLAMVVPTIMRWLRAIVLRYWRWLRT
jgi:hypothetical protein